MSRSNKKVWWKCSKNHSWETIITSRTSRNNGCPYCSNQKILKGFNDLQTLNSELCKEWDYDKNIIKPDEIASKSSKKIWWKCNKGHSWQEQVIHRTNLHIGCPYCSNHRVLKGFNDLLSNFPELCKEWDYDKNDIKPDEITSKSHKKIWWKCNKGHSWQVMLGNRTDQNTGCPYCSNNKVLTGFNDLLSNFPELCKEWDYDKNDLINIKPDKIVSKSGKKVWWKCHKGHSWQTIIRARVNKNTGCPYCAGIAATEDNNLLIKFPELCKEWDYDKNDLRPDEVTSKSGKKVWWKCSKGHSWKAIIYSRTSTNTGCPICSLQYQTSFGEQSIYYYLKDYNVLNRYKYQNKEIDIYLPNKNIGIEFNGIYWHRNKNDNDQEKEQFFTNNGIKMFYIYEFLENKIENNKIYFDSKHQYNNNLEWSIKELFKLLNFNIDVNIEQDKNNIYKQYKY